MARLLIGRRELLLAGGAAAALDAAGANAPAPEAPRTVDLWPGGAPGGARVTVDEEVIDRSPEGPLHDRYVQHVTRPTLSLFEPQGPWNGITLLMVPGGGYVRVVMDKEGFESARWFAERGFAAAVLRYRLPADGWEAGADAPVHDARRALRWLREHEWPAAAPSPRLGIMGFSAGGHLTARVLTEARGDYPRQDALDDEPARADFGVLMYPVIATTGAAAHAGSVEQLRRAGVGEADLARYSPASNVTANTPPTMLVHAGDDTGVVVANSLLMYAALRAAGVRSELHVFDRGGHGFGLRGVAGKNVAVWPQLVQQWALGSAGDEPR